MRKGLTRQKSGFVLIVTLLMVVLLSAMVVEYFSKSRIGLQLARNISLGNKALQVAEGGVSIALELLAQRDKLLENEDYWAIVSGGHPVNVGEGTCTLNLTQESGKLNLNRLVNPSGQLDRRRIDQLLRMIDLYNVRIQDTDIKPISYGIVPAIIDWIDADDEVTVLSFIQGDNRGAEQVYYQDLKPSYDCKNAPLGTISELLHIKGVTPELLYGYIDSMTGETIPGLESCLTTYGGDRLNINYTSTMMIQTLMPEIDLSLAENLMDYRPYDKLDEIRDVPGMTEQIYQRLSKVVSTTSNVPYYRIEVRGVVGNISKEIQVLAKIHDQSGDVIPLIRWE